MDTFWLDLRYAARALRRAPYVIVAAALSIGLGIGAATAVFSWMDAAVLHPFPAAADQDRLVGIEVGPPNGGMGAWSYPTFKELRDATRSFTGMAAWRILRVAAREPGEVGSSPLLATTVSGNYFDVLGAKPLIGRAITNADVEGASPVAMVGAEFWMERWHGDASVIGKTLLLNGQAVTIIGIAPQRFSGVYTGVVPHLYVPLTLQPRLSGVNTLEDRKLRSWLLFARLAPGVSIAVARDDADAAARRITASYGDRPAPGAVVMPLRIEFLGATLSPLFAAMLGVSGVLVLLASANVASLLLVRGDARRREVALRRAIGASAWRVVRLTLLESALLALAGSALGVATAYLARGLLYSFIPRGSFPVSLDIPLSWRVLLATLGAAVTVTVVCGVAPALAAMRIGASGALREGGRGLTGGPARARSAIVAGQIALSVVALVLAGMFVRGLQSASRVDVGFSDPQHVLLVDTDLGAARLTDTAGVSALDLILRRLRALPGVQTATVASMVPLGFGGRRIVEVTVEGYAPAPNENMSAERAHVGPAYAATMKIRVVRGRDVHDDDRAGTLPVALVNEAFVRQFFPGRDPIGQRVDAGRGWATIVGVLHDGKYDRLDEPPHPVVYVPTAQWFLPGMTIHLRTLVDPRSLAEPVRRVLSSVNPDLPAVQARTLAEHISASTFLPRTGAMAVGAFAALALLLSGVGLYGVLAYSVALRGREIAIKLALGAGRIAVAWSVARRGLAIAGVGVAVGGTLAIGASGLIRAKIQGLAPRDPVIGVGAVLVLFAVTVIASWVPARSAVRVDPAKALRSE
jgi:putative ABC transport system permease protein